MTIRDLARVCFFCVVLSGCTKKAEPVPITGWERYTDPVRGFSIEYPANWSHRSIPGEHFYAISIAGAEQRFVEYGEGPAAAKLEMRVVKTATPLDQYIKEDKVFADEAYKQEQTTLAGVPATKLSYQFEAPDGMFKGFKVYAVKDSFVTTVEFAAFGGTFDAYTSAVDRILRSVTFPQVQAPAPRVDTVKGPEPPSTTFVRARGSGYSLEIPDNFRVKGINAQGALGGSEYLGSRLDCTIRVDVLDASKQSKLDKIAADNRGAFGGGAPQKTKLGGVDAVLFSYSPQKGIQRQVYLAVKDAKLYRVFLTWNKQEEATYKPVFERAVASFKFE
ncbi:MAG: hypothetical protein KatS3mg039_1322 [Candidatus Kapaibacterium sp.]|nr:MAG: hypothetical protein KatS3mg039_1322 [Candidatus Kapabacteria bacterium]